MSNSFVQIPTPAGNGTGAAVDVTDLGANKTILFGGTFDGVVTLETSSDDGVSWGPVVSETGPKTVRQNFSSTRMRMQVSGLVSGAPIVFVGCFDTGSKDVVIPVTALDGAGAAAFIGDFGEVKTIVSGAPFTGSANIEISDNGTDWSPLEFFTGPGIASQSFYANWIRCRREGVIPFQPNQPILSIVAADDASDEGSTALREPAPMFVFRPFDPEGDRENVYTTWTTLYTALIQSQFRGLRYLFWDTRYCPISPSINNYGRVFTIPAGTWDMRDVVWTNDPNGGGDAIKFTNRAFVEGLTRIEGYSLAIFNDSVVSSPFVIGGPSPYGGSRLGLTVTGVRTDLANTAAFMAPTANTTPITPGATTIDVATTVGYPITGTIEIANGESVTYTGKTATSFTGTTPIVGTYPIGTPMVVFIGATALSVNAAAGAVTLTAGAGASFPTSGSLLIGAETLAYTRAGAVFTVPPTALAYPAGTLIFYVTPTAFEAGLAVKPLIKLGGSVGMTAGGQNVFGSLNSQLGLPCFTPVLDISGFTYNNGNVNFENNAFNSLRVTTATGAATSLTGSGAAPGATTLNVGSTAAFPASGSLSLAGYEIVTYTGKTATSFTGVSPLVHGYGVGTAVIVPIAIAAGSTTIACSSTTGFAAAGSLNVGQGGEVVTYTGVTATSFTGVSPVVGNYPIGTLLEPTTPTVAGGSIVFVGAQPIAQSGTFTGVAAGNQANGMNWLMPKLDLTTATVVNTQQLSRSRYRFRVTTPTTITPYQAGYNEIVPVNTDAPRTVQLPTAARAAGETLIVKDAGGVGAAINAITIAAAAGQTVDGAASVTIVTTRGSAVLVPNGVLGWLVVARA